MSKGTSGGKTATLTEGLGYARQGKPPAAYPKSGVAPLLRLDEAAERLAVSLATVRRLVKAGQLPAVRVGRVLRVRPQDLEAYIRSTTEGGENG